jgi:hypothetical protein
MNKYHIPVDSRRVLTDRWCALRCCVASASVPARRDRNSPSCFLAHCLECISWCEPSPSAAHSGMSEPPAWPSSYLQAVTQILLAYSATIKIGVRVHCWGGRLVLHARGGRLVLHARGGRLVLRACSCSGRLHFVNSALHWRQLCFQHSDCFVTLVKKDRFRLAGSCHRWRQYHWGNNYLLMIYQYCSNLYGIK